MNVIKYIFCVITMLFLLLSCTDKNKREESYFFPLSKQEHLDSLNRPLSKQDMYFPDANFDLNGKGCDHNDSISCRLYSQALYELDEPIMSVKYLGSDMYRFFFGHESIIRAVKQNNAVDVVLKKVIYPNERKGIILYRYEYYQINSNYWDSIDCLANKIKLWNPPVVMGNAKYEFSNYFLEGNKKEGYSILGPVILHEGSYYNDLMRFRELMVRIISLKPYKSHKL